MSDAEATAQPDRLTREGTHGPSLTIEDVLGSLELAAGDLPSLVDASKRSVRLISQAREKLVTELSGERPPIDVVAFGSLARLEMTDQSDFDYLVLSYGLDDKPGASRRSLAVADSLRSEFRLGEESDPSRDPAKPEIKAPGSTGMFGTIAAASELVNIIGLERDTNHSHSRRILLLEESVSLYDQELHRRLLRSIVARYLEARPIDSRGIPRFLLNDLSRYWRTLAVDYQAKTAPPLRFSLRYLKLLVTRKFTYASSLAPLFSMAIEKPSEPATYLVEWFEKPPLCRFLSLLEVVSAKTRRELLPVTQELYRTVDKFNGMLGDPGWRDNVREECASLDNPREGPSFGSGRILADSVQECLEKIFFSEELRTLSMRYLVF